MDLLFEVHRRQIGERRRKRTAALRALRYFLVVHNNLAGRTFAFAQHRVHLVSSAAFIAQRTAITHCQTFPNGGPRWQTPWTPLFCLANSQTL